MKYPLLMQSNTGLVVKFTSLYEGTVVEQGDSSTLPIGSSKSFIKHTTTNVWQPYSPPSMLPLTEKVNARIYFNTKDTDMRTALTELRKYQPFTQATDEHITHIVEHCKRRPKNIYFRLDCCPNETTPFHGAMCSTLFINQSASILWTDYVRSQTLKD